MTSFRIIVDADRCEANAVCLQVAPQLFTIGSGDVAEVVGHTYDDCTLALATEAARRCPTGALLIEVG